MPRRTTRVRRGVVICVILHIPCPGNNHIPIRVPCISHIRTARSTAAYIIIRIWGICCEKRCFFGDFREIFYYRVPDHNSVLRQNPLLPDPSRGGGEAKSGHLHRGQKHRQHPSERHGPTLRKIKSRPDSSGLTGAVCTGATMSVPFYYTTFSRRVNRRAVGGNEKTQQKDRPAVPFPETNVKKPCSRKDGALSDGSCSQRPARCGGAECVSRLRREVCIPLAGSRAPFYSLWVFTSASFSNTAGRPAYRSVPRFWPGLRTRISHRQSSS